MRHSASSNLVDPTTTTCESPTNGENPHEPLEVTMPSSLSRLPWSVTYLARRTAGVTAVLAEQLGAAAFPSRPHRQGDFAAGYAAGVLDALGDVEPVGARA